mmetsp:Transcript_5742/g.12165  ORF Transcript_5742/g.12165 Transcript_5742/m.12165 type:complete len:469 (+) Transcript_5742:51-1457(+)
MPENARLPSIFSLFRFLQQLASCLFIRSNHPLLPLTDIHHPTNRLIMKSTCHSLRQQRSHTQRPNLRRQFPINRHGIADKEIFEFWHILNLLRCVDFGILDDSVCSPGVYAFGSGLIEHIYGASHGASRVDNVVHNNAFSTRNIPHQGRSIGHGMHLQGPSIADESDADILPSREFLQCISESIGAIYLILVSCYDCNFWFLLRFSCLVFTFITTLVLLFLLLIRLLLLYIPFMSTQKQLLIKIRRRHRPRNDVIHRTPRTKKPLQKRIMQIHTNHAIHPHLLQQLGHIRRGNRLPLHPRPPILPRIPIIRNDRTDPLGRPASQSRNRQEQLHDRIGRSGRADDEDVFPPHVILDLHARFSVREGPDVDAIQFGSQQKCHFLPEPLGGGKGEEAELGFDRVADGGGLVEVHLFGVNLILSEGVGADGVDSLGDFGLGLDFFLVGAREGVAAFGGEVVERGGEEFVFFL